MGEGEGKSSSSTWRARRNLIVLAALCGTLAAAVMVIIISVVLRPAHVEFAVARATRSDIPDAHGYRLDLTVTARSTSGQGRASVKYRSVFVFLALGSTQLFSAHVEMKAARPDKYLPAGARTPPMSIDIDASVVLVGQSLKGIVADRVTSSANVTVIVKAQVLFMIGVVSTRVYDIVVSCPGVVFLPVNQTASPRKLPITCT